MISEKAVGNLVTHLEQILALSKRHQLDEIALLQPLNPNEISEQKLHFIVSKKNSIILPEESFEIARSLYKLLEVEYYNGDIQIDDRNLLSEEYLKNEFGAKLLFTESISQDEIKNFITKKLELVFHDSILLQSKSKKSNPITAVNEMKTPAPLQPPQDFNPNAKMANPKKMLDKQKVDEFLSSIIVDEQHAQMLLSYVTERLSEKNQLKRDDGKAQQYFFKKRLTNRPFTTSPSYSKRSKSIS